MIQYSRHFTKECKIISTILIAIGSIILLFIIFNQNSSSSDNGRSTETTNEISTSSQQITTTSTTQGYLSLIEKYDSFEPNI